MSETFVLDHFEAKRSSAAEHDGMHDGSPFVQSSNAAFDGVKVFAATMLDQRARLGDTVTAWLAARPELELVDMVVRQSSDDQFHCVSIIVFYRAV